MNKKGVHELIKMAAVILLTAFIVIVLIRITYLILSPPENDEVEPPIFYYNALVKDMKELPINSVKKTFVALNEDYTLVGFDKDIKAVSYQGVDIKRNPETGLYETILVFDI